MVESILFGVPYIIRIYSYNLFKYTINEYTESALEFLAETTLGNLILWFIILIALCFGFKYFIKGKLDPEMEKLYTIGFTILSLMGALYSVYYLELNPIVFLGSLFIFTIGAASIIIFYKILSSFFEIESTKGVKLLMSSIIVSFFAVLLPLPKISFIVTFVSVFLYISGMIAFFVDTFKNPRARLITILFLFFIAAEIYYSIQHPVTFFIFAGIAVLAVLIAFYQMGKHAYDLFHAIRDAYKDIELIGLKIKDIKHSLSQASEGIEDIKKILPRREKDIKWIKGIKKILPRREKDIRGEIGEICKKIKRIYEIKVLENVKKATKELYDTTNILLKEFVEDLQKGEENKELKGAFNNIKKELKSVANEIKDTLRWEEKIGQYAKNLSTGKPKEFFEGLRNDLEKLEEALIKFENEILNEGKILDYLRRLLRKGKEEKYEIFSKYEERISKIIRSTRRKIKKLIKNIEELIKNIDKYEGRKNSR